ncbi:Nucleolar protein 58 [Nowakowskiella sp. JEL0078]|nr:Nucleolar protein 58 [Nowakowskiella sp. JEL0078]
MLVLFETPAGYALFKATDEGKFKDADTVYKSFETPQLANSALKLRAFSKFENTTDALSAITGVVEGKLPKNLKKFLADELSESELKDKLAIGDSKLGASIAKKFAVKVVCDSATQELMRGIRSQLSALISGIPEQDMKNMVLGLSHSLSRYKLKFSPDKVDTMIVQAIALLDDLDKELNTYSMRVKEWYGWHFPEMGKIIVDNIAYAKVVKEVGMRVNFETFDLSSILPEELEKEIKEAAEVSMGTEISEEDRENIVYLCDQVISISEYRVQLYDYLKNRMNAIAPNLTCLVGELVGARLISHAGSLLNLAKQPASTVQILGAEKALFRALKTKHDTPKYGLIYHASIVGQAGPKIKGKIARTLATKAALSIRVDALGDKDTPDIGIEQRAKVEFRLRQLEGRAMNVAGNGKSKGNQKHHSFGSTQAYNASADIVTASIKAKKEDEPEKKKKKRTEEDEGEQAKEEEPKKLKKRKTEAEDAPEDNGEEKKKKKKKSKESKE